MVVLKAYKDKTGQSRRPMGCRLTPFVLSYQLFKLKGPWRNIYLKPELVIVFGIADKLLYPGL